MPRDAPVTSTDLPSSVMSGSLSPSTGLTCGRVCASLVGNNPCVCACCHRCSTSGTWPDGGRPGLLPGSCLRDCSCTCESCPTAPVSRARPRRSGHPGEKLREKQACGDPRRRQERGTACRRLERYRVGG